MQNSHPTGGRRLEFVYSISRLRLLGHFATCGTYNNRFAVLHADHIILDLPNRNSLLEQTNKQTNKILEIQYTYKIRELVLQLRFPRDHTILSNQIA